MFRFLLIIIALSLIFSPLSSRAQTRDQTKCDEAVYVQDFSLALFSFFDYSKATDEAEDALKKSVLYGNSCWSDDVGEARRRLTGVRESMRRAFYECNNDRIASLKHDYYKTEVELEFLRTVLLPNAGLQKLQLKPKETMTVDLQDYFVNDREWLTNEEVEAYVNDFYLVYSDRFDTYNTGECVNPGFAELKERIKKLKEELANFGGVSQEIDKQNKKLSSRNQQHAEIKAGAAKDREAQIEKEGEGAFILDKITSRIGVAINGLKPLAGLKNVFDELKKNAPTPAVTFRGLSEALKEEQKRYQNEVDNALIDTEYKVMYQNAGAEIAASLVNIMEQTIDVTNQATSQLQSLQKCADVPLRKHCSQ